ncbi:MAG: hypothetical protein V3V10_06295 [Planctomycetota bacterium]
MLPEAETDYVRTRVVRSEKKEAVERTSVTYTKELSFFCVGASISGFVGLIICLAKDFHLTIDGGGPQEIVGAGQTFVVTQPIYDVTTFVVMLVSAAFVMTLLLAIQAVSDLSKMSRSNQYLIGTSALISLFGLIVLVIYG